MIRRIEIDKSGGVCLQIGEGHGWYDISAFPPRRLDPLDDRKIPMSPLVRERRLDVVGYRPARRLVAVGREGGVDIVWKGYRRGRVNRYAANYRLASAALQGSDVRTPDLAEVDVETDCIAMPRVSGQRPRVAAAHSVDFRLMGSGTRALQSSRQGLEELGDFKRDEELAVLEERVRRLALAGGSPPEGWRALYASLTDFSSIPAANLVVAHRDLHDGQWLVDEGRPCLLDFDLMCRAEPELDPANFLAHLELRQLQHPAGISAHDVAACREAFLDGLGSGHAPDHRARLAFYQATTFARLALVYQLRPRWAGIVGDLLALGRARLAELGAG